MFDVSWGELLIVGAVALVVIGPKDLPGALRSLGQMTSKLRRMASDFQNQFNDAMREADLEAIRKDVTSVGDLTQNLNPLKTIEDEIKGAIDARPPESGGASSGSAATAAGAAAASATSSDTTQLQLAAVPDARGAIADLSAGAPFEAALSEADPGSKEREAIAHKPTDAGPERKPDAA